MTKYKYLLSSKLPRSWMNHGQPSSCFKIVCSWNANASWRGLSDFL